jgi:surfactin synthase thioesterase subunit
MGVEEISPWLIRGRGDAHASTRVFCFHSMGVGASLFTRFLLESPAGCDLYAVQTPGRENRSNEPAADSVSALVDEIVREIEPWLGERFVFWGHSFGGIVAYETIRRLQQQFGKEPSALMITGTVAPSLIKTWQNREVMLKTVVADNEAEYLISLSRYVEDAAFIKAILPIMRKDTPLMMSYRYHGSQPLHCPVVAFGARQDDMVYLDEIAPWREETSGAFELVEVDGDHWFLNKNRNLILERLSHLIATRSMAA